MYILKVWYPYSVHDMRIVLLALVSGVSFGQGPEVAKQLLQEVADSAAHAASWRIEGSVKYMGSRTEDTDTSSLSTAILGLCLWLDESRDAWAREG